MLGSEMHEMGVSDTPRCPPPRPAGPEGGQAAGRHSNHATRS